MFATNGVPADRFKRLPFVWMHLLPWGSAVDRVFTKKFLVVFLDWSARGLACLDCIEGLVDGFNGLLLEDGVGMRPVRAIEFFSLDVSNQ